MPETDSTIGVGTGKIEGVGINRLPWWSAFPVSIGIAGMSAFAGQVLPAWLQVSLFVGSAVIFVGGVVASGPHFLRVWRSGDTANERLDAYRQQASSAFQAIGEALGQNTDLAYEHALASIEPMFLLMKRNGIPIPRLRGDGVKLGILRAHRFLNLLNGPFHIGDDNEAKRRAIRAVPLINEASADRLWRDVQSMIPAPAMSPTQPVWGDYESEWDWQSAREQGATQTGRDTPLPEALAYIATGEWGKRFFEVVSAGAEGSADGLLSVRQMAHDGRMNIWGRLSEGGIHVLIPTDYWVDHGIEWFELLRGRSKTERATFGQPSAIYADLMVSRAQIEEIWPWTETFA